MPTVLEALHLGLQHQRAGRLPEAEGVYRAVLSAQPENADALHLLGVIACETGKTEAAVTLVQQAIRLRPTVAQFHNTLGNALASLRRLEESRFAYEWALRLDTDFAEAHVNLGNLLQDLQKPEEAVAHYRRALERRPGVAEIHNNLGNALRRLGLIDEAIASFRQALRLNQRYPEAFVNLAAALLSAGELDEAGQCCEEAIRLNPGMAAAHSNFAAVLVAQGRFEKAEAAGREALRLHPEYPEAQHNLADALRAQGRNWIEEAAELSQRGRFAEAEACCRHALDEDPRDADAHRVLGNVYYRQRRLDEAASCYDAALALRPDDAGAHWNRAVLLLLRGQFEEGWREYEWRWRRPDARPAGLLQPRWHGEALDGRRILVLSEQGLGDCIQFLRYLPMVEQAGGRVVFQCPPALTGWLAKQPGLGQVVDQQAQVETDLQTPLLSLPHIFRTTLQTIPHQTPYLSVEPRLVETWRGKMASIRGFRVGIVWAGSPLNTDDTNRSIPPEHLRPLWEIPGVSLVCLQQNAQAGEFPMHYVEGEENIEDLAGILMNLDLVISVDTMPAHLAGALGRPVWTLLRFAPEFRWLLDREDSPWYPTMRLFRQDSPGDWDAVVHAAATALRTYACGD